MSIEASNLRKTRTPYQEQEKLIVVNRMKSTIHTDSYGITQVNEDLHVENIFRSIHLSLYLRGGYSTASKEPETHTHTVHPVSVLIKEIHVCTANFQASFLSMLVGGSAISHCRM